MSNNQDGLGLERLQPDVTSGPIFIMVAGGSATGKTSQVVPQLLAVLGDDVTVIRQDWYQLGIKFKEKSRSLYRWDDPRNFQIDRLKADLDILKRGDAITAPSFDVTALDSVGRNIVTARRFIVVEGVYSLYGGLHLFADHGIYVEMPLYGRFLRRLFRTVHELRQEKPQTVFRHMFGPVLRAHRDMVKSQIDLADCIVSVPYCFAESIVHHKLNPLDVILPTGMEVLFDHDNIRFLGSDEGDYFQFYVIYKDRVYCHFPVDRASRALLSAADYMSV